MYLLDTNHCSSLIDDDPDATARLSEKRDVVVATSIIVRGELLYMAAKSARPSENRERVQAFLRKIGLFPLDEETADAYAELKQTLVRHFGPREKAKRRKITTLDLGFSDNDLWIAATALRHGLTLVSADRDFTRIQEARPLALETWLPAPP